MANGVIVPSNYNNYARLETSTYTDVNSELSFGTYFNAYKIDNIVVISLAFTLANALPAWSTLFCIPNIKTANGAILGFDDSGAVCYGHTSSSRPNSISIGTRSSLTAGYHSGLLVLPIL